MAPFPEIKNFSLCKKSLKIPGFSYFALQDFLSKKNVEDKKNEFFSIAEKNHKTRLNENIKINMNMIEETIKTFPNQEFFQEFPFLKKYLKNP